MALPQIETLETMARQTDRELRQHGFKSAYDYVRAVVLPARNGGTSGLVPPPANRRKILDLFGTVCETMNLFSSMAVVYLVMIDDFDKAAENPFFLRRLSMLDKKALQRFLEYALRRKDLKFASVILLSKPRMQFQSVLKELVDKFYHVPEAVSLIKIMLARGCLKKQLMVGFVQFFIRVGHEVLFQYMAQNDFISLAEVITAEVVETNYKNEKRLVFHTVLSMIMNAFVELAGRDAELYNMMGRAVETGLSTVHGAVCHNIKHEVVSPLWQAILQDRMSIVRLMYRTGAVTNQELFEFREDVEKGSRCMEGGLEGNKTYRYVICAARHPRRLQELCLLAYSHMVGCRSMQTRAKMLDNIPRLTKYDLEQTSNNTELYTLKDRVLFKDALLDFTKGTTYRAKSRDPPGFSSVESDSHRDPPGFNSNDSHSNSDSDSFYDCMSDGFD